MKMDEIKASCSKLTELLYKLREQKSSENEIDRNMLGEVMSMFAQLSGQHHKLLSEIEVESEKTLEWQEKCEAGQEVLDEQLAYINYMDTEYDTRQWKATDDIISVNADDDHTAIKNKLDTELAERRRMCENVKGLQNDVNVARKQEEDLGNEFAKVKGVMVSMTVPKFLEGILPCDDIIETPTYLPTPFYIFHQLMLSCLREYNSKEISMSISTENPIRESSLYKGKTKSTSEDIWSKIVPYEHMICLKVRERNHIVLRYHSEIKVVSCDHTFTKSCDGLANLVPGDTGLESPHVALDFTFKKTTTSELVKCGMLGRLYFWLHELCGLDVVSSKQRPADTIGAVTHNSFIKYIFDL